jgi:hypothetical protein
MKNVVQVLKFGAKMAVAAAAVVLAVGMVKGTAYADEVTGVDGGVRWTISADGTTLTIAPAGDDTEVDSSNGVMKDYNSYPTAADSKASERPKWGGSQYDNVTTIVIKEGVTNIGAKAFGTSKNNTRSLTEVSIPSTVTSIGGYAFANDTITKLVVASTDLTKSNISEYAFLKKDGSNLTIGVTGVVCYKDSGTEAYFTWFNEEQVVTAGEGTYSQSDVTINLTNIDITSYNLLGANQDVSIQWNGVSSSQTAKKTSDKNVISYSTANDFISQINSNNSKSDYDYANYKFFDLSIEYPAGDSRNAKVTIPVPADWSEHYSSIQVWTRAGVEGSYSYELLTTITQTSDEISFTAEHFSPYVLYYNYPASASSGGGNENGSSGAGDDGDGEGGSGDSDTEHTYDVDITANYFSGMFFKWWIGNYDGGTFDVPTSSTSTVDAVFTKFSEANTTSNPYKVDSTHLKAFDLTSTVNGTSNTDKIDGLYILVPVPDEWASRLADVQVITIDSSTGKIENINNVDGRVINGVSYVEFTPSHFSPYALYLADVDGTTATTVATTTTTATTKATTTAATTKATTTASSTTTNAAGGGSNTNSGSGKLDYTPGTGVKDFMWIAVPIAVLLMGVGVVVLAMRKRKNLDE